MAFSQEPFPETRTTANIEKYGKDSPFRHWKVIERYIQDLVNRRGYEKLVSYNTTVELVSKNPETRKWTLTLRRPVNDGQDDHWWQETFDGVIVANGHYTVPFVPHTPGLQELAVNFPGIVQHSKAYRKPETYWKKRIIIVGASISGPDISFTLADVAETPVHSVVRGRYHPYFFDYAFQHPNILRHPAISHITSNSENNTRIVHFEDGTKVDNFDYIIFATGYSWTLPFLPDVAKTIRKNRVPNLYQHIFLRDDPTLCFVGASMLFS
jgi:cation diffusion facilitator CzcD-associated flavoprotein CzcO